MFKKIGSLVLFVGVILISLFLPNSAGAAGEECCLTEFDAGVYGVQKGCYLIGDNHFYEHIKEGEITKGVASDCAPENGIVYFCAVELSPEGLCNLTAIQTNIKRRVACSDQTIGTLCASVLEKLNPPSAPAPTVESNCYNLDVKQCSTNNLCFVFGSKCYQKTDESICRQLPQNLCGPNNVNGSSACIWTEGQGCLSPVQANIVKQYSKPTGYQGALPDCAFSGTCRDVNDLLVLVIRFASGFFGILGTFALGYFIYGGFTMILSFGNAEKVKKGRDILVAAVVGLLICFFAYAVIKFMLVDVLNVAGDFNVIK